MPEIFGVIPARLNSSRFPGKLLHPLSDKPLIQHTYENACHTDLFKRVYIATDSEEIAECAKGFGAEVIRTSSHCLNGTERIAEAVQAYNDLKEAEIIINIQGDEPFVEREVFNALISALQNNQNASLSTVITPILLEEQWKNPSIVKCVTTVSGEALYFSRAAIPGSKGQKMLDNCFRHIGLYGYRPAFLAKIKTMAPTPLQQREDLEQLQFLELGYKIATATVTSESIGIDTPEDLQQARDYLCKKNISL